jgi:signal transduction histidine kinase
VSGDQLAVLGLAVGSVLAVAVPAVVVLRLLRHRSLRMSLIAVPVLTLLAVAAAVIVDARVMFLSAHDRNVVVLALAAAAPPAVGLAAWLGRDLARSGRDLAAAARALGAGRAPSTARPPVGAELAAAHDELVSAATALAAARERQAALETSRRELGAWVSHDLRTPLAGIRAMAEALEDGVAEDPAAYHKQLRIESDRLSGMVDTLFLLSRIHAGALRPVRERVALGDLVSDALASARPLADARAVRLDGDADPAAVAQVDVSQLSRAVSNLLSNAIRHTPAEGTVTVTAGRERDQVVLAVRDGCGGIPEPDLSRVFEVAWRGGRARSPGPDSGAGLGLAVVRGIVEAHDGSVTVCNVPGGCRFEARLPLA